MNLKDQRFKTTENLAKTRKNTKLFVTFTDKDDATVLELEGSVADFVDQCDGSKTVNDITSFLKLTLDSEEDNKHFTEMLSFLEKEGIIEQCN
jgi:peptidoglycan/xylan/chitin deacetylase (PgdA/CDA1 family)